VTIRGRSGDTLPCRFERSEKSPCGKERLKGAAPHFVRGDKMGVRGDNKGAFGGTKKGLGAARKRLRETKGGVRSEKKGGRGHRDRGDSR